MQESGTSIADIAEFFTNLVGTLGDYVWSTALISLCLGAGLFYSILTRFVQVRLFSEMIRLLFSSKESMSNRRLARSIKKKSTASIAVARPSILKRRWARNGTRGYLRLSQFLPAVYFCQACNRTVSVTPRISQLAATQ